LCSWAFFCQFNLLENCMGQLIRFLRGRINNLTGATPIWPMPQGKWKCLLLFFFFLASMLLCQRLHLIVFICFGLFVRLRVCGCPKLWHWHSPEAKEKHLPTASARPDTSVWSGICKSLFSHSPSLNFIFDLPIQINAAYTSHMWFQLNLNKFDMLRFKLFARPKIEYIVNLLLKFVLFCQVCNLKFNKTAFWPTTHFDIYALVLTL